MSTKIDLPALKVWKYRASLWTNSAQKNGTSVADEANKDLRANQGAVVVKLKQAGDDFYCRDRKRGFTRDFVLARALESAWMLTVTESTEEEN